MLLSIAWFDEEKCVSIRTRPFGRVMHPGIDLGGRFLKVSIRTRPFGRVMRLQPGLQRFGRHCFNPHPAFRPGDAVRLYSVRRPTTCFNPHPAFRPGDA